MENPTLTPKPTRAPRALTEVLKPFVVAAFVALHPGRIL